MAAYSTDFCNGGTASADSVLIDPDYIASKAFDDIDHTVDSNNLWCSANTSFPHWIKYDLGVGITKTAAKLRVDPHVDPNNGPRAFVFAGSNNDSDYTTIYSGEMIESEAWQEFTFSNSTAYRYYRITWSTSWKATNYCAAHEIEMMELGGGATGFMTTNSKFWG